MRKIKSVVIHWSESSKVKEGEYSLEQASKMFCRAMAYEDQNRGYFKTKVTIKFDDGEEYTYRHDLGDDISHILLRLESYYLFISGKRKPSHMTQEEYDKYTANSHNSDITKFLSEVDYSYDITEITQKLLGRK